MVDQDERVLIAEARDGSAEAFEDLMKTYENLVYRASYFYTSNRDDALDVTQEVFIKVYRRLESFTGSGSFKAWLLRITHNESLNWIRGRARHGAHERLTEASAPASGGGPLQSGSGPLESGTGPLETGAGQESDLARRESREHLIEAMARLNPRQGQAIALRYFDGLSIPDIAAHLGCSEGTAKSILFRGLRRLRDELPVNWRES